MVVTDYHKKRTIESVQKGGTMEFPTRWLCCTGKWSCESKSCDRISTYRSRKKEKYGPSAQEHNTFAPLSRRSTLFSRGIIKRITSNLPSTIKIGQWRIGRGSCGQIRPRSTGLGQMEGPILGNKGVHPFVTILPLLLSSMEEEIILWYGGVWDRMGLGSS